jgi:flagellar FliL protein
MADAPATPAPIPAADAPDAAPAAPAPSGKGKTLIVMAVAGLVLVAGLGGAAWFFVLPKFLHPPGPETAEAKPAPELPVKATVPLGSVVVNVKGEGRRYLKVSVDVGVTDAKEAKEVEERKPQVLDLLITVLSSKDVSELTSGEGRAALKEELLAGMRDEVGLEHVSRVFFTEFVIQ